MFGNQGIFAVTPATKEDLQAIEKRNAWRLYFLHAYFANEGGRTDSARREAAARVADILLDDEPFDP